MTLDAKDRLDRLIGRWQPAQPEVVAPLVVNRSLQPRTIKIIALALIAVISIAMWMWLQGRPQSISPLPESSVSDISGVTGSVVVHVTGNVAKPGTVSLPAGSRVEDAIERAGGANKPRQLDSVNLARLLVDGEQIVVGAGVGSATSSDSSLISLNQASVTELDTLPGVGPVLAERIVAWREANGGFRTVEDLNKVSGIGDATMADISPLVRV